MEHSERDEEVRDVAKSGGDVVVDDDKVTKSESGGDALKNDSLDFMEVEPRQPEKEETKDATNVHDDTKQNITKPAQNNDLVDDNTEEEREEAERRERSEEVKAWLSGEEYPQLEKPKSLAKKKVRVKKEIFRGNLSIKKKRSEQKNGSSEKMTAHELVGNFEKILNTSESKINEIQNILNDHENDKKENEILLDIACRGEIDNDFKNFLKKQYDNKNDSRIIKNIKESVELINTTTRLEDLLYNSIKGQLKTKLLVTQFAIDFTKENFQDEELVDLKIVDTKIRDDNRLRNFYDTMTALSYHGLMTELALRIAIASVTLKSFRIYKELLLDYPIDYTRYKDNDEKILNSYTMIFNNIFSELVIAHDDDCPNDADDNLKAAYQLNNETADFYEKIKESVTIIADGMNGLKDFLSEKENYTEEKRENLLESVGALTNASEEFEKEIKKDLQLDAPTIQELRNCFRTDTETVMSETIDMNDNIPPKLLTMLSLQRTQVFDLIRIYNEAKNQKKDLLWRTLEAKEKYLLEIQAINTALVNIYQLEQERRTLVTAESPNLNREIVEKYYRKCTGYFEIIFRNLTSVTTYIYNALQHQLTDIAADGPDGELVHTLDYICEALKVICRRFMDEHYADLMIFVYRKIFQEPENEDYLYFAEVEKQITEIVRKYWPATLMPEMSGTSEAMIRANEILGKYNGLNVQPSEMREAMTAEEKKEVASIINEVRTNVGHFMSWHTENGIGSLYSLYDFTIYSPESLIKRANPNELAVSYLTTSADNAQGTKLLTEETKIEKEMRKLTRTDSVIYIRLNECADSYLVVLKMFRQFYTLFNQRNVAALEIIRSQKDNKKFDKKELICGKDMAPQIKNVLVNFVRSYVRFSKQFILLVKEYDNAIKDFYQDLPKYEKDVLASLEYVGTFIPNIQKTLTSIRSALVIIQDDQDAMIAKYMKTLLAGIEKCWVGDIDTETVAIVSRNLNIVAGKLGKENSITQAEAKGLLIALQYNIEPLEKWVDEKEKVSHQSK